MNNLIQELINELKSNSALNDNIMVKMVLESINNSVMLGAESDEILENALSNLSQMADLTMNENLKEVVSKFMKMSEKPTKRLQDMAREAGLSIKLKALKESALFVDPMFKHTLSAIERNLSVYPEFRLIGPVIESLTSFVYDETVKKAIDDLNAYVNENRSKLEIINAIYEMRQTGAVLYRESIAELENCLLEEIYSADAIKMKLHGKPTMPILTRLINTLSMVEARESGSFNIGIGNGDAQIKPVIAPFLKVSDSEAIAFIDNAYVKLTDDSDPANVDSEELQAYPEFTEICEAFAALNFKELESGIVAKGRNITLGFDVNAEGSLDLKINGAIVEDLSIVKLNELIIMEQMSTRASLSKIMTNLGTIVNFGFAKKLVNERLDANSIVLTFGETLYIFEKAPVGRTLKKMNGLDFHSYVMEKFNYDVSDLYAIELSEREEYLKSIEAGKSEIEADLLKLENTIAKLDETLSDSNLDDSYATQLSDLKVSIERNVTALKNQYLELELSKKK